MRVLVLTANEVEALRNQVDNLIEDSEEWGLEGEEKIKSDLFWNKIQAKLLTAELGNDVDPVTE